MKTYLVRNTQSTYGYQLKVVDDEGNTTFLDPIGRDPNTKNGLKLPDNPSNRKWISPKPDVEEQEIPYKESKHFGQRTTVKTATPTTSKGWTEHLTDEEKAIIEEIKTKALKRKEIADIKAKIEALKAQLPEEDQDND